MIKFDQGLTNWYQSPITLILIQEMTTSKFQVEKFTGENDFHLWWLKMRALLIHQGLEETLGDPRSEKKPSKLSDEEMQDALDKAHSTLILSLRDGVLREVGDQTTAAGLWK